MNGKLCPDVLYSIQLKNLGIFITKHGITYAMVRKAKNDFSPQNNSPKKGFPIQDEVYSEVARLDLNLTGAFILPENCSEELFDNSIGVVNYYSGGLTESALNLHYIKQLLIKQVYPGIDWLIKIDAEKGLKYDFIINPGADPSLISLQYKGAEKVILSENKQQYKIYTPLETFTEGDIACYTEDGTTVKANYFLKNDNEIGLGLSKFDEHKKLIIDPAVSLIRTWATYFGGTNDDIIWGNKIDIANGKIYFVGQSNSVGFPPLFNTGNCYYTNNFGGSLIDAFICRTDLSGVIDWCTYVFSSDHEIATDVAVDHNGYVYMVGYTRSNTSNTLVFPTKNAGGYFQGISPSVFNQPPDGFITKFYPGGKMQWSSIFGATTPPLYAQDIILGVACNSTNDVYIVGDIGTSGAGNFPFQQKGSGYINTTYNGNGRNGFISEFDQGTNLLWSTLIPNEDENSIAIDHNDNIFTCGIVGAISATFSPYSTLAGTAYLQPYGGGVADGTIIAFDNHSNLIWQTYLGGSDNDWLVDCDISESDQTLYVGGRIESNTISNSINFPFVRKVGGYYDTYWNTTVAGNNVHGFFGQFDTDFSDLWITLFAGNGTDEVVAVNCNAGGNLFVTGNNIAKFAAGNIFPLYDAHPPFYYDFTPSINYSEPYIAMFETERDIFWCTYYGDGVTSEYSTDIDVSGRIMLWSGWATNSNQLSTVSTLQENNNSWIQTTNTTGGYDGMIAKFYDLSNPYLKTTNENSVKNSSLNYELINNPIAGNKIKIKQLFAPECEAVDIQISDVLGHLILKTKEIPDKSIIQISLPNVISKGIYNIIFRCNEKVQTIKFIVEN